VTDLSNYKKIGVVLKNKGGCSMKQANL